MWVVFLRAGSLECDGAAAHRHKTGGRLEGGSLDVQLQEVAVYKLCTSSAADPWLDSEFHLATSALLLVEHHRPPSPARPPSPPSPPAPPQTPSPAVPGAQVLTYVVFNLAFSSSGRRHLQAAALPSNMEQVIIGFIGDALDFISHGDVLVTSSDTGVDVKVHGNCSAVLPPLLPRLADLIDYLEAELQIEMALGGEPKCGSRVVVPPSPPVSPPRPKSPPPSLPDAHITPSSVLADQESTIRVSASAARDDDWVVFLQAGTSDCSRAATTRPITGGRVQGGVLLLRLDEPGVYKMCVSQHASPYLDSQFELLAGVMLVVTTPQPSSTPDNHVLATFKVEGAVDTFDATAFAQRLAALLSVSAADIVVSVEAASVRLSVLIRARTTSDASLIAGALGTSSLTTLNDALGIAVLELPTVQTVFTSPLSPPPAPSQLPGSQLPSSPAPAFTLQPQVITPGVRWRVRFLGNSPPAGSIVVFLAAGVADCVGASRSRALHGFTVSNNASLEVVLEERHVYKLCLASTSSPVLDSDFAYVAGAELVVQAAPPAASPLPPLLGSAGGLPLGLSVQPPPSHSDRETTILLIVPPCVALVAVLVVQSLRTEPHFAGLPDLLATIPLFLFGWIRPRKQREFALICKVVIAALYSSLHFCLVLLFVIDLWSESADETRAHEHATLYCDASQLKSIALALLVVPSLVTLGIGIVLVVRSLQYANPLLKPEVVRQQARPLSVTLMLAALDEGMLALLPWTSTVWGGFPARWLLVCFVITMLVRQVPLIILVVLHISCGIGDDAEHSREVAMLVLLVLTLVQELVEKGLLSAGQQRLEELPSLQPQKKSATQVDPMTRTRQAGHMGQQGSFDSLDAESEAARQQSKQLARDMMRGHLRDFVHKNGREGTYESWIAQIHPENVTVDYRLALPDSEHLAIWNEVAGPNSSPPRQAAGLQLSLEDVALTAPSTGATPSSSEGGQALSPNIAARLHRARSALARGQTAGTMGMAMHAGYGSPSRARCTDPSESVGDEGTATEGAKIDESSCAQTDPAARQASCDDHVAGSVAALPAAQEAPYPAPGAPQASSSPPMGPSAPACGAAGEDDPGSDGEELREVAV